MAGERRAAEASTGRRACEKRARLSRAPYSRRAALLTEVDVAERAAACWVWEWEGREVDRLVSEREPHKGSKKAESTGRPREPIDRENAPILRPKR